MEDTFFVFYCHNSRTMTCFTIIIWYIIWSNNIDKTRRVTQLINFITIQVIQVANRKLAAEDLGNFIPGSQTSGATNGAPSPMLYQDFSAKSIIKMAHLETASWSDSTDSHNIYLT